eukprot:2338-Heterococcus_DN1.PRE.11
MAPASAVAGLKAENALLREQLHAERCASQQKVEQLLIKNGAALSALKDEVRSIRKSERRSSRESDPAPFAQRKRHSSSSGSSSTDITAPLDKNDILDNVFGCVGGGDHLYVGGVSRTWRGRYMQLCAQTTTSAQDKKLVTRFRSAIMSESRLQYAKGSGFRTEDINLTKDKHALLICKQSLEPQQVITVLRLHGVPWNNMVCRNAACFGKLRLLQWLHSNGCQWNEYKVLMNASRGGSVPMLEWLKTVTKPWSKKTMGDMLVDAASCGCLTAAKWLKAADAQWPASFVSEYTTASDMVIKQCWCLLAVQWAIASGSGWLDWKCEDYTADKYDNEFHRKQATGVLRGAHANGCPCTCGLQQQQQQ